MQTRLRLNPGQNGTKKLARKYGEKLVCVRYRYDPDSRKRYKTVEIIVEEVDWNPTINQNTSNSTRAPGDRMGVKVDINELEIRDRVKRAGGIWRPRQKLWELSYAQIVFLGLEDRIRGDVTKSI